MASPPQNAGSPGSIAGIHNDEARDPSFTFVIEVAKGSGASALVYLLFRLGESAIVVMNSSLPVYSPGPSDFLSSLLSWGGAITSGALWLIVAFFQLLALQRKLLRRHRENA